MPGTSKARNPQGWEIIFDEASHTYTTNVYAHVNGAGKFDITSPVRTEECSKLVLTTKYISGTSFIHKFFTPFDPDGKIATRKAQERGVSIEQIRFEWRQKADEACKMGTRVHETCEDILHDRRDLLGNYDFRNKPESDRERQIMSSGFRAATYIKGKFNILGIEQIVFDFDLGLAGTIDLLVRDPADDTIWILDWKTNERIDFHSKYGKRALAPIAHLEDCSAVHYGLQLSLYEYLLKKAKYLDRGQKVRRAIFHLGVDEPHFHELPDYSIEVRDMMIEHLNTPPF